MTELGAGSWAARKARGDDAEDAFGAALDAAGLHYRREAHRGSRPDFFLLDHDAYVQVADGRRSGDHDWVIKEQSSVASAVDKEYDGHQSVLVWWMPDGHFSGHFVNKLFIEGYLGEGRANGSGTPAWKIRKTCLVPFDELLAAIAAKMGYPYPGARPDDGAGS